MTTELLGVPGLPNRRAAAHRDLPIDLTAGKGHGLRTHGRWRSRGGCSHIAPLPVVHGVALQATIRVLGTKADDTKGDRGLQINEEAIMKLIIKFTGDFYRSADLREFRLECNFIQTMPIRLTHCDMSCVSNAHNYEMLIISASNHVPILWKKYLNGLRVEYGISLQATVRDPGGKAR